MSFRVGSGAREDVAEIAVYMDSRTSGRGDQFIVAIEQAYAAIGADPRSQAPADDGPRGLETRQHLISGFQYRIVFAIVNEDVVVLSVAHVHRKPGHWRPRLRTDLDPETT